MQYRFGAFELDARKYELRRDGMPLRVEPRVLDLLLFLIRHRDRVVSREELLDSIWKEKFIGEAALTRCVMEARKIIAVEGEEDPIRTVHRRGYRFVASVIEENLAEAASVPEPVQALEPVSLPESPVPVPESGAGPAARSRRLRPAITMATVGFAGLLIAMVALPRANKVAANSETATLRVSSELKVTRVTTSGKATDAAISPDGKFIAYVVDNAGSLSIRMRQVATGSDRELVTASGRQARKSLSFTPDGSYVAYLEQHEPGVWALYRVPALGGVPQRLVESVETSAWSKGKDFSFAPDGNRVAFVRRLLPDRTALLVSDLRGQERQIMVRSGELLRPVWGMEGKTLLCHWKVPGYSTEIRVVEVSLQLPAAELELQVPKTPLFVAQTMLPDGKHLIGVGGRSLSATAFYLAGYPSMKLAPITQGVAYWRSPSVTPDGRSLVAVRVQQTYNLWTGVEGETAGHQLTFDVDSMEGIHGIAVTTKSGELVYTSRTNGENNHVWIASADGRRLRQLTSGDEDEFWPAVSPSGDTIFYGQRQTAEKRSMRIWRMDLSTGRSMQLTTGSWDMLPAVTPDGRFIIYTDGGAEVPVIRKVSTSGGASETIATGILFAPAISPDGQYLAGFYARTMSDDRALVTMRLDDGKIVERIAVDSPPAKLCLRWAADGRGLIIVQTGAGVDNLWLYPLGGGKPRQLTKFHSLDIAAFNLMPDGKTFVLSRGRDESDVVLIADLLAR